MHIARDKNCSKYTISIFLWWQQQVYNTTQSININSNNNNNKLQFNTRHKPNLSESPKERYYYL